ncbi:hypothetical protein KCV06_g34, partial [Aureobasidium melanogenum]
MLEANRLKMQQNREWRPRRPVRPGNQRSPPSLAMSRKIIGNTDIRIAKATSEEPIQPGEPFFESNDFSWSHSSVARSHVKHLVIVVNCTKTALIFLTPSRVLCWFCISSTLGIRFSSSARHQSIVSTFFPIKGFRRWVGLSFAER